VPIIVTIETESFNVKQRLQNKLDGNLALMDILQKERFIVPAGCVLKRQIGMDSPIHKSFN
jgi:hypothetical protein